MYACTYVRTGISQHAKMLEHGVNISTTFGVSPTYSTYTPMYVCVSSVLELPLY